MKNSSRESLFRVLIGLAILLVIAVIVITSTVLRNRQSASAAEAEPFPTNTPSATSTPVPTPTRTPRPTAMPTDSAEPDLRFGLYPLGNSCDVYTKILVKVLEEQLRLDIEMVTYPGPADLFADLAEANIDYTLCYAGLDDRQYLTEYVGFLSVYDNRYVEENGIWMQPVVATRKLATMRREQPCLHDLLGEFTFTLKDRYVSPNNWVADNDALIQEWIDCQ